MSPWTFPSSAPFDAVCALAVVLVICRWVFSTPARPPRTAHRPPAGPPDYGLLVTVATGATEDEARQLRERLTAGNIRTTQAGRQVLVFPADVASARALVDR